MTNNSIRFSVCDGKGNRASTWHCFTAKSPKNDVYLTCRETGHAIKSSLHESGSWHYAYFEDFFTEKVEELDQTNKDRFIDKWMRPPDIAPGVTLAFRIVIPWSSVTTPNNIPPSKNIVWVPKPSEGYAIEFYVIFTRQNTPVNNWPGKNGMDTELIGSLSISSGDTVWIVYREIVMPEVPNQSLKLKFYKGKGKDDLFSKNLRMLAYTTEEDGSRVFFDFAVQFGEDGT